MSPLRPTRCDGPTVDSGNPARHRARARAPATRAGTETSAATTAAKALSADSTRTADGTATSRCTATMAPATTATGERQLGAVAWRTPPTWRTKTRLTWRNPLTGRAQGLARNLRTLTQRPLTMSPTRPTRCDGRTDNSGNPARHRARAHAPDTNAGMPGTARAKASTATRVGTETSAATTAEKAPSANTTRTADGTATSRCTATTAPAKTAAGVAWTKTTLRTWRNPQTGRAPGLARNGYIQ